SRRRRHTRFPRDWSSDVCSYDLDRSNIESIDADSTRVRVQVADGSRIDEAAVRALGLRGIARPAPNVVHLLVGQAAPQLEALLRSEERRGERERRAGRSRSAAAA